MKDFCDATFCKEHPVFKSHPQALQLVLYYDDTEVANLLGSKAGVHKLGELAWNLKKSTAMTILLVIHAGCFYYTLGNIRPIFRSNLRAIQLLAVAKTSDIRTYGCEALLQPFVQQMNLLSRASSSAGIYTY